MPPFQPTLLSKSHADDAATVPPAKTELDELLDACGRRPQLATLQVKKAELDSLKNLAVSVAYDNDEDVLEQYMHLRSQVQKLPKVSAAIAAFEGTPVKEDPTRAPTKLSLRRIATQRMARPIQGWNPTSPAVWVPALTVAVFAFLVTANRTGTFSASAAAASQGPTTTAAILAPVPTPAKAIAAVQRSIELDSPEDVPVAAPVIHHAAPTAPSVLAVAAGAGAGATPAAQANPASVLAAVAANNGGQSCESAADDAAKSAARGDFAAAEAAYATVLRCNPTYVPALVGRADAAWNEGDHARAAAMYRRMAEDVDPQLFPARVAARAALSQ